MLQFVFACTSLPTPLLTLLVAGRKSGFFGVSISLQMLLSSLVMLFLLYVHQSDHIYLVASRYLLSIYYAQHIKSAQLEYWIK